MKDFAIAGLLYIGLNIGVVLAIGTQWSLSGLTNSSGSVSQY